MVLLLIYALQHRLIHGSTVQQVLDHAAHAANDIVKWLYPNRPVVVAFMTQGSRSCILQQIAERGQVLQTVKQIGLISNILPPAAAFTSALAFTRKSKLDSAGISMIKTSEAQNFKSQSKLSCYSSNERATNEFHYALCLKRGQTGLDFFRKLSSVSYSTK